MSENENEQHEGPPSLFEVFQKLGWEEPLTSPFEEIDGTVMVIGTSMGHGVIGSVDEYPEDLSDVYIHFPLSYQEMPDVDRATGQMKGVNVGLARILNAVSMPRMSRFRMDYFTILRKSSSRDAKLMSSYKEVVTSCLAADSGISAPPPGFTGRGVLTKQ
jgi:hypothetical protein